LFQNVVGVVVCSIAGAVYDILGYVHPFMTAPHDGMNFSTPLVDQDLMTAVNCASYLGGGWWYTRCSLWCSTSVQPMWYSLADNTFYSMKNIRMMIKPQ